MYKSIDMCDIIGSFFVNKIKPINKSLDVFIDIENEIAQSDPFMQINCSMSERKRAEYLGDDNVSFSSYTIVIRDEIPNDIKDKFIRCYYGLDNESKEALSSTIKKIWIHGEG